LGWLKAAGLDVKFCAGVRVAFDYLGKDLKTRRSNDDLLAIENLLREQVPFWGLGRYVHLLP
jgi:S-adenosylmethionine-dependent methyltransferase